MDAVARHLREHDFGSLFVEDLGWDRGGGVLHVVADGRPFTFNLVAHKRGLQVLSCTVDGMTLVNRRRLRRLQRETSRAAHEHILIYVDTENSRQVWQWSLRLADGRRMRLREHPFPSSAPPERLLERISLLRFGLDEEEHVTLLDALQRARLALDTEPDVAVFFRNPDYLERGAELLAALRAGGEAAFREFVSFHMRLAPWVARPFRHVGIDEEDLHQIAYHGLLRAVRHFDHDRGCQFSTYAVPTIRRSCFRDVPEAAMPFAMPAWLFWEYRKFLRLVERVRARGGDQRASAFAERWLTRHHRLKGRAPWLRRAFETRSLSDPEEAEHVAARRLQAEGGSPETGMLTTDVIAAVNRAIDELSASDAQIVRRRYGLGGDTWTLEEIGTHFGVTKERIRQRQLKAEAQLYGILQKKPGLEALGLRESEPLSEGDEQAQEGLSRLVSDDPRLSKAIQVLFREISRNPFGVGAVQLAVKAALPRGARNAALRALVECGRVSQCGVGRKAVYRPQLSQADTLSAETEPLSHVH